MIGAKKPGFTLIELLIVTVIFSLASTVLARIFISFNQLHRKIVNAALLGQDMRFAMELLVRESRDDQVDYSTGVTDKDTVIKLITSNGLPVWVALGTQGAGPGTPACSDPTVTHCLVASLDSGTTWTPITSNRVEVTDFDVYVRPTVSPFVKSGGVYPNNTQPFVTLNIGLRYNADRPTDDVVLQAQTSVSSRIYQR